VRLSSKSLRAIAFVGLLGTAASCAEVPVYQRSRLAHPTMVPGDGTTLARDHMYAIHEGATGGSLRSTSGCGCN
jgi:hypothetical protein